MRFLICNGKARNVGSDPKNPRPERPGLLMRAKPMIVTIQLFASLKEALGETIDIEVPEPVTVSSLLRRFVEEHPQFAAAEDNLNVAVDLEYSRADAPIGPGQEVAIFPPVSGGRGTNHEIVTGPIDERELIAKVASPGAGAIATFHGVVRDNSLGRKVLYLLYEAYPPMAVRELENIEREIRERWEVEKVAISHRIGRLEIGESSVVIAVSSPHRKEALEASQFAIDRLKQTVPVWKKEYWEGGEVWIENPQGSYITQVTN